jgi:hypothetical protein
LNLVAPALGIDPTSTVKITETGDEENPFKVEVDGEDRTADIRGAIAGQAAKKTGGGKKLEDAENARKKAEKLAGTAGKNAAALQKRLEAAEIVSPLRAAFAAVGAVDSGGEPGTFADLIALARPFVRAQFASDEDTGLFATDDSGAAKVSVYFVDEKGEKVTDAQGAPITAAKWVEKFLEKRPAFKAGGKARGPGAGGYGTGGSGAAGGGNAADYGRTAGAALFGVAPAGTNGQR